MPVAASCPACSPLPAHPGRWPSWSSPTHGEKATSSPPPQRTAEHSRESHHLASLSDTCSDFHLERVGTWSIMTLWPSLKCHEWPEQDSQTLSEPECIWLLPPKNFYPKSIPFHLSTWAGFIFLQLCITSRIWGTPRWADHGGSPSCSPFPLPAFHSSSHSLILLNVFINCRPQKKSRKVVPKNKQRHTLRHTKVSISTYSIFQSSTRNPLSECSKARRLHAVATRHSIQPINLAPSSPNYTKSMGETHCNSKSIQYDTPILQHWQHHPRKRPVPPEYGGGLLHSCRLES